MIIFLFIGNFINAQKITIKDSLLNTTIKNVLLKSSSGKTVFTNTDGSVDISGFDNKAVIYISCIGYRNKKIIKNQIQKILFLAPKNYMLSEIDIFEKETPFVQTKNTFNKFSKIEIQKLSIISVSEVLEKILNISIQENQRGGSSLNLRGMEANRLLLVVDGIVLNNAIYRSGHVQASNFINPFLLENVNVVHGPSSISYGDGSMGSAIIFNTLTPSFVNTAHFLHQQYESSSGAAATHYHTNYMIKNVSFLSSINTKSFGNLRMGSNRIHKYTDWGSENHVLDGLNQLYTNYDQITVSNKAIWKINNSLSILLNSQYFLSSKISRFDKMNDFQNNSKKYLHWYYGPQNHLLQTVQFSSKKIYPLFDRYIISLSFQDLKESRNKQKMSDLYLSIRKESVQIYDLKIDFNKRLGKASLNYGLSCRKQEVSSSALLENLLGETRYNTTRYPDGGSKISDYSLYAQLKKPLSSSVSVYFGARCNKNILSAEFIDTTTFHLPFNTLLKNTLSFSSSFGASYKLNQQSLLNFSFYTGFRNPNLDDVGKVFSKNDILVVVPNNNLLPEKTINFETEFYSKKKDSHSFSITCFYTVIKDAILRDFSQLNGLDSMLYDGEMMRIQMNQNSEKAIIYGGNLNLDFFISKNLSFKLLCDYKRGFDYKKNPVSHIPPLSIKSYLDYEYQKNTFSLYWHYNAWKKVEEYDLYGVDNLEEATQDGTPAWYVLNCSFAKKIDKKTRLTIAVENILDVHYKRFASSVSSSGRNLILSLQTHF